MKRILLATDFSARSDRALGRAVRLARAASAELVLLHVVDEDHPARLLELERREAEAMLEEMVQTIEGVRCRTRVEAGDPSGSMVEVTKGVDADLLVVGAHRRRLLKDVFVGGTMERTIRRTGRPALMVQAPAGRDYERVLVATDFSDYSRAALDSARSLGLLEGRGVTVLHALDSPARELTLQSAMTEKQFADYLAEEEQRAREELAAFLRKAGFQPSLEVVRTIDASAAETIVDSAKAMRADLVVVGTRGRSGLGRFLIGSVAEGVLHRAEMDVLAVPAPEPA